MRLPRGAILLSPIGLARAALGQLEGTLASAWSLAALQRLPAAPGEIFSFGCFECRLDDEERIDFLACTLEDDAGRIASAKLALGETPLDPLLKSWALAGGGARDVNGVWMEWDRRPDGSWSPFSFLRLAEGDPSLGRSRARLEPVLSWGLSCWAGMPAGGQLLERVLALADALPPGGRICHLAALAPRGISAIRVHLGLPKDAVVSFAAALGWKGELGLLRYWMAAWSVLPDPIGLQIDLGDAEPKRVDLEFYLDSAPSEDERWAEASAIPSRIGEVLSTKLEAALRWADGREVRCGDRVTLLRRTSLKISVESSGRESAKAYLGFSPREAAA